MTAPYRLLHSPEPTALETMIAALAAEGYQLHGETFVRPSTAEVCQPMVLGDLATAVTGVGTAAAGVTAAESGSGGLHKTVLTFSGLAVTTGNTTGASFGTVELYDYPEGRLAIIGVTAQLTANWAGTDIALTGSGDFSIGTTGTTDATLDGTDVDLLPSTALTDPAVAGVASGSGALATGTQLDGTVTAKTANLNLIIDDADVADGASDVVLVSGTVTITWAFLGDL